ncbi:MAG: PKD domain-containing protein, partial [Anaerolineae bacterium]
RDSHGESTSGPVWDFTTAEAAKADLDADPTTGAAPLGVAFTNLSTGDFDNCLWDFGDGTTSSVCAHVSHIYEDPGSYTVMLTVSGLGGSDTETRTDYVTVNGPVHPVSDVALRYTPAGDVFAGNTVYFVAQAQGTVPFTYAWTLNGQPIGDNQDWLEHTFDAAGSYTVEVTVVNAIGQDSALTTLVIRQPEPEGQPDLSCSRQVVNPTSVRSGDMMTYTLILRNSSAVPATASLADPIPAHTTYVPGSATASDGAVPTLINGEIHWSGQIVSGAPVVIEYVVQVQAAENIQEDAEITSLARLEDGLGNVMLLGADASYNAEAGLTIENGTLYTNVPTVTLSLWSLEGLPQMQISNSAGFGTGTGWVDAETTTSWILDTRDHLHTPLTVYALFRGENGQQHGPVHDDIIYDPVPPRVTEAEIVTNAESGPTTAGTENTFVRVMVSDDNSGVSQVQVSDDPDFETWWEFPVNARTIEIPIPWEHQASDEVFVRAVDRAGNPSDVKSGLLHHVIAVYLPLVISSP